MSTQPVSAERVESTRKIGNRLRKEIGDAVASLTQLRAAEFMDTSASTVSRIVASDLDGVCHLMAAVGLQFAPLNAVVVERHDIQALERMAYKYLQTRIETDGGGY